MRIKKIFYIILFLLLSFSNIFALGIYDSDKYAWGDKIGWLNFKADNGNVDVTNTKLSGYVWNENYGWINLDPDNSGVKNDGNGNLSGYAWGENLGWIDFSNVNIDANGYFKGTASIEDDMGIIVFEGDNISVRTYWSPVNRCTDHGLHGYAWSDNIGWISFDCRTAGSNIDYGVDYDKNGNLSGYAWSDNIGWISFNSEDVDEAPRINMDTLELEGQARALSGWDVNDPYDDWDGLISLAGYASDGSRYSVKYDKEHNELYDYAWGDEVIGWIEFRSDKHVVTIDPFYFSFTADKGGADDPITSGDSVILSWATDGAVECKASDGQDTSWTDNPDKATGDPYAATEVVDNITKTTKFSLTCKNAVGNSIKKSVVVRTGSPTPQLELSVDDDNIPSNTSTTIHWKIKDVQNCKATSSSGTWDKNLNSNDGEHSDSTGNLTDTVNLFKVKCDSKYPDEYPDGIERTIYVYVEKLGLMFYPEHSFIKYGDKIILYWEPEFAQSCTASGDLDEFNGNKDASDGRHRFVSSKIKEEGKVYKIDLECTGNDDQKIKKSIILRSSKNPKYIEI